jgi:hypothetical protein
MIDENQDHIDQLFKDQYEQVEVRYNAAHWTQLQGALAAATAAGIASSVPSSAWSRIAKFFYANQWLTIISGFAITVITVVILFQQRTLSNWETTRTHQEVQGPKEIPATVIAEDTFLFHGTDSVKLLQHGKLVVPDTSIKAIVLGVDTIDSLDVDTVKKDIFIFW